MADEAAKTDTTAADLAALQRTVASLTTERDGLKAELSETRHEARDRRHESKSLAEQLGALTKERDELRVKAETDPDGLRKQVGELTGKLRGVTHRQAFDSIARANKVTDPGRQDDLWSLLGWKAEADEPDAAKLTEAVTGALKTRPHFLDQDTKAAAAGVATNASGGANGSAAQSAGGKPGPGADRGQSSHSEQKGPPAGWVPGRL